VNKRQTTKKGVEIPIPKRGEFFGNLKKAAAPERETTVEEARRAAKHGLRILDKIKRRSERRPKQK
jgi:hypothetical protein